MAGTSFAVPVAAPLWDALRRADAPLSLRELGHATRASSNSIKVRLGSWRRAGLVEARAGRPMTFMLTSETERTKPVPKVNVEGTVRREPTQRDRVWRAMRILGRFDLPQLLLTTEASRSATEDMINMLQRAGLLVMVSRGNAKIGSWSVFRFAERPGPLTPTISNPRSGGGRRLHDPNTGRTYDVSPGAVDLHARTKARRAAASSRARKA